MKRLEHMFELEAAGSNSALRATFEDAGLRYHNYPMSRGVSPLSDLLTLLSLFG